MDALALDLPSIQAKLDTFNLTDIYNRDETGLQYRILPDHSLSSRQLEGRKKGKNVSTQLFVQMVMEVTKYRFGSLVDLENLAASKTSIWTALTSNTGPTKNLG